MLYERGRETEVYLKSVCYSCSSKKQQLGLWKKNAVETWVIIWSLQPDLYEEDLETWKVNE